MTLYQPNQPQRTDYPQWPPQQQFYQQPGNPMMSPQFQPPSQPPTKKRRKWPIILLVLAVIVAIIILASALGNQGSSNPTKTTTSPTQAATTHTASTWKTTHTFTGNGSKKTETFSVPDDWKINWTCNPSSFQGLDYNVIAIVYNSDGTLADSGINSTCKKGSTSGSTEIHTSGNVYLDITSEGNWTFQIQELK